MYLRNWRNVAHKLGRHGGLIVSALGFGSSGLGSSPGLSHSVVFLSKTLDYHSAGSLHPDVWMGTDELGTAKLLCIHGTPSKKEVQIPLAVSYYRRRDNLQPLGLTQSFALIIAYHYFDYGGFFLRFSFDFKVILWLQSIDLLFDCTAPFWRRYQKYNPLVIFRWFLQKAIRLPRCHSILTQKILLERCARLMLRLIWV